MKLLDGFELIELTEDKIVQERRFGEKGVIRTIGNPNPPPDKHQQLINNTAKILMQGYVRSLRGAHEAPAVHEA